MPSPIQTKSRYAPFDDCPEPLREFLSYILNIRSLSVRTVDGYYIELRTFLRFLVLHRAGEKDFSPEKLREQSILTVTLDDLRKVALIDIYAYLNACHADLGNGGSARARKLSALSSFFRYLTNKTGQLAKNPMENLDRPSVKRALPKYLTLNESSQLLQATADLQEQPAGINARNYCMLTLFLNCGMRLSELVSIDRNDIRDDHTLKLLGKGNKERIIYLNDACVEAVRQYQETLRAQAVKPLDNALFIGRNGRRLSPRRVEQIIGECLRAAGLDHLGYTPHKLRHTAATLMYQYGHVDVRVLKEILGHSNLATTEIYTHVSSTQMEQAAQASPLSQSRRTVKPHESEEK